MGAVVRLPDPCVVVLVGASGAGKSVWAGEQFPAGCGLSVASLMGPEAATGAGASRDQAEAGTVEEQVGRYRELAEAGVQSAVVGIDGAGVEPGRVERFGQVIAHFQKP